MAALRSEPAPEKEPELDPAVVNVGGDPWNQETAVRLEREFVSARPKLDDLLKSAIEGTVSASSDWEGLPGATQEQTEEAWKKSEYDDALESETTSWQENDAEREAKVKVVDDFSHRASAVNNIGVKTPKDEWAKDAIKDHLTEREEDGQPPIPYTRDQLLDAVTLKLSATKLDGDVRIVFDDKKLQDPDVNTQKETLPGFDPEDLAHYLTPEMRADLKAAIKTALDEEIERVRGNLEPPDHLAETAQESVDMMWNDLTDSEKYAWAQANVEGADVKEEETEELDVACRIRRYQVYLNASPRPTMKTSVCMPIDRSCPFDKPLCCVVRGDLSSVKLVSTNSGDSWTQSTPHSRAHAPFQSQF